MSKKNIPTQDYRKKLVVVTAPSGAGKSTIISRFMARNSDFTFCISHTTRTPREREKDGREYYFISDESFEYKIKQDHFIEWANVHGHYYGTSFEEIQRLYQKGKKIILDIDVQGSQQLKLSIDALYIFISVPDINTLKKRLMRRGTEDKADLNLRIKNAKTELAIQNKWSHVIMNNDLDKACKDFETIVNNYFNHL